MPLLQASSGLGKLPKSMLRSFPPEDSGQVQWLNQGTYAGGYVQTTGTALTASCATYTTANTLTIQ